MTKREAEIDAEICAWFDARGIFHWRMSLGGLLVKGRRVKGNLNGFPDRAGIIPSSGGRFFAVEIKRPGEQLRPEQVEWQRKLRAQGVLCFVATSVEDCKRELDPEWKAKAMEWPGSDAG